MSVLVATAAAEAGTPAGPTRTIAKAQHPWQAPALRNIRLNRAATHHCQRELGADLAPVQYLTPRGFAFRRWVARLWQNRAGEWCSLVRKVSSSPEAAICYVWGSHCANAIRVARCESGSYWPDRAHFAVNGQYLGMFQMGDWARSTYGHGSTFLTQARAAYRNFLDNGWRQWECAGIVGIY
jgi:hypothetical protein